MANMHADMSRVWSTREISMRNAGITQLSLVPGCLLVSVQTQFLSRVARVAGRELYPYALPLLTRPASLHVLTDSTSCKSWFPCFCGVLGLNRTEGTELQSYSRTAAWRPCKRRPGGPSASLLLVSWYVLADPRVQISRSSSFVPTTYGARRRRGGGNLF